MSIILNNISKSFNTTAALKNISLQIEDGKTTVLIGPSGCGKSTLIRIITGLIKPDSGEVLIEDKTLTQSNLREIRLRIGYVIQEGGLFPHLTAKGNVSLVAEHLGWPSQKIEERITELTLLTKFPFEGLKNFPAELSGGQRQRVSLMRALMLNPEFLLFDEPLGALDPLIRYNLQTDLKEIFRKLNKTVLLVTHDLNEAVFFADKIVLMKEGEIIQQGTFDAMLNNPSDQFVTTFIKAQRISINLLGQ
jgi:osmoprotectant transport system ATP-binding protein